MTTAPKPKWQGFDDLLCKLADAMDGVLGDKDASLHAARHVMLLFLKHDAWLARTNQPESYVFDHGGNAVPLDQMDMLNPHFWRYFEAAEETGAFYETLASGGPWAEWQFGADDFAFGLSDDPMGPIVGRVRDVQVWARTGKFAKPSRGRPLASKTKRTNRDPEKFAALMEEVAGRMRTGDKKSVAVTWAIQELQIRGIATVSPSADRQQIYRELRDRDL